MLDIIKNGEKIEVTVETAKLKTQSNIYLIETIVNRLADLYLAKYGERILAELDDDVILSQVKKKVVEKLTSENS